MSRASNGNVSFKMAVTAILNFEKLMTFSTRWPIFSKCNENFTTPPPLKHTHDIGKCKVLKSPKWHHHLGFGAISSLSGQSSPNLLESWDLAIERYCDIWKHVLLKLKMLLIHYLTNLHQIWRECCNLDIAYMFTATKPPNNTAKNCILSKV